MCFGLVLVAALSGAVGLSSCALGAPAPAGSQSGALSPDGGLPQSGVGGGGGAGGAGGMGGTMASGCDEASCSGDCCNMLCVNTQTDDAHCGGCNMPCPFGTGCQAGKCECPGAGQSACTTGCVNLSTSNESCGECALPATRRELLDGECKCPGCADGNDVAATFVSTPRATRRTAACAARPATTRSAASSACAHAPAVATCATANASTPRPTTPTAARAARPAATLPRAWRASASARPPASSSARASASPARTTPPMCACGAPLGGRPAAPALHRHDGRQEHCGACGTVCATHRTAARTACTCIRPPHAPVLRRALASSACLRAAAEHALMV